MPKSKPCCAWACCSFLCIPPVGGLTALVLAIGGVTYLFAGLEGVLDALDAMGANFDDLDLETYYGYVGYGVIIADALVVAYGLREKIRTRMNMLGHLPTLGLGCLIKFAIKSLIHISVCGAFVFSSILMLIMEALYVLFLAIDASCDAGGDSVQKIVNVFSKKNGTIDDICDAMSKGKDGSLDALIGSMIITVAQVIAIAYWYKYSTLAMVPAFFTTGVYSKEHETNGEKKKRELRESADGQDGELEMGAGSLDESDETSSNTSLTSDTKKAPVKF